VLSENVFNKGYFESRDQQRVFIGYLLHLVRIRPTPPLNGHFLPPEQAKAAGGMNDLRQ